MRPLTPEEKRAIAALKRLAKTWPPSLTLWLVPDSCGVVRVTIDHDSDDSLEDFIVADVEIPIDGGFGR